MTSNPNEFRDSEIVDIHIEGARVVNTYGTHRGRQGGPYEDTGTVLVFRLDESPSNERSLVLNLATPGVTVERRAPAEWPPQPGDLWRDRDDRLWFAVESASDDGVALTCNGRNRRPAADIHALYAPLTLVRREGGAR